MARVRRLAIRTTAVGSEWAPYDLERREVMLFDTDSVAVDDPHRDEREAMSRYDTQQALGRALHR